MRLQLTKADVYIVFTAVMSLAFLSLVFVHPLLQSGHDLRIGQTRDLVGYLGLTDLCLFTEARYTRHITQADMHSAFQDHPFAFEHFPSGSILPPPSHLTGTDRKGVAHAMDRPKP
jgi:hypothetical protein